ncbi:NYN domain-containing protein, partial [Nakamurella sp.]|uniref:NYN domain-containing protein n=1 Tax=Nakamurella sp. TaxID=1869182 RepID=UPI003B3A7647
RGSRPRSGRSRPGRPPAGPADLPADLPAAVRTRIVGWAAEVVGRATVRDLSPPLQRVARFAPAKRAQRAAGVLTDAVRHDEVFRAMVAEHVAGLAESTGDDPASAAARAVLLRSPDAPELLDRAAAAQGRTDARARIGDLEQELRATTARLARAESRLAAQAAAPPVESGAEAERLKKRLREQGTRVREMQDQLAAERSRAQALEQELARTRQQAQVWQEQARAAAGRADAAAENVRKLRETSDDRRAADDRRLDLLLQVLEAAASGLRREWDLIGGGPAPAEVVASGMAEPATDRRTADPVRLAAWVGLPGTHLIVDGYNVSKTGFAELSLADQRDRLVRQLSALAARTSAEVTVVFDGAAVTTTRPFARGVRVLFSAPGVQADDVIADLVRAEPTGRPVVVISSDRRVADHAVRTGARSGPSSVFLALLTGGPGGAGG